jgi:hypothetical protein
LVAARELKRSPGMNRPWNWKTMLAVAAVLGPVAARADGYYDGNGRWVERPYHSVLSSAWDNSITVNPIDLFTGTINIEYERAVASRIGVYTGLNFIAYRGVLLPQAASRIALGPEIGMRVYLIGRAPGGLWLGPYLNAAWVHDTSPDAVTTRDTLGLGAGGMAGINLLFGQFNLSLGAGAGYQDYAAFSQGQRTAGSFGVTPRLRLALGAVF